MTTFQQCQQVDGWQLFEMSSTSHPGTVHEVRLPPWNLAGKEGVCDCDGFRFKKGTCSHLEAAKALACRWNELTGPEVQSVEQRDAKVCPRCEGQTHLMIQKGTLMAPATKKSKVEKKVDPFEVFEKGLAEIEDQEDRLTYITSFLDDKYVAWKDEEGYKNKVKDTFFEELDEYVQEKLEREIVSKEIVLREGQKIEDVLKARFPEMELVQDADGDDMLEEDPETPGTWIAVMQQAPAFIAYSFVNKQAEKVFARGITDGRETLDAAAYLEYVPTLAQDILAGKKVNVKTAVGKQTLDITKTDLRSFIRRQVSFDLALDLDLTDLSFTDMVEQLGNPSYSFDEEKAAPMIVRYPHLRAALDLFTTRGKPTVKLNAPRKAKKDEL